MGLIEINPDNPQRQKIEEVVEVVRKGGVIIYPTDSVYAFGCDIFNQKAIDRICRIKSLKPKNALFSIVCFDLSHISQYTRQLENHVFKMMKKTLPGPYTYILNGNSQLPKMFPGRKKTIGIRVPDNEIPREIVNILGNPIVTTSLKAEDEVIEYNTDPELIHEMYGNQVDLVIAGGFGNNVATTVINCTSGDFDIVREGLGDTEPFL